MTARKRQSLADLRPNAQISCFHCEQIKSSIGAVRFCAHLVCADCTAKLKGMEAKSTT